MELRRRIKALVLLSLSLFVILFLVSPQFTGFLIDSMKINVGISMSSQGCMYFLNEQSEIQNDTITFDIVL